mgnify:CR=1 FL=1
MEFTAWHLARNEKIGMKIYSLIYACGDERIETAHLIWIQGEPILANEGLFVMVETDGVPSKTTDHLRKGTSIITGLRNDATRAHVDTEKSHRFARTLLEFKMVANRNHATIGPRRHGRN